MIVNEIAIFFDAVGTLFRVRGGVGQAYAGLLQKYGEEVTSQEIDDSFVTCLSSQPPLAFSPGLSESARRKLEHAWWRSLVIQVLGKSGTFSRFNEYFDELFEYFKYANAWDLCENTVKVLEELSQCWHQARYYFQF